MSSEDKLYYTKREKRENNITRKVRYKQKVFFFYFKGKYVGEYKKHFVLHILIYLTDN